jgi:putative SOS response-associated peptidase YedK
MPNNVVAPVHAKAMPVILTTPEECDRWLTAEPQGALTLQRPLPDAALRVVATGVQEDWRPGSEPAPLPAAHPVTQSLLI